MHEYVKSSLSMLPIFTILHPKLWVNFILRLSKAPTNVYSKNNYHNNQQIEMNHHICFDPINLKKKTCKHIADVDDRCILYRKVEVHLSNFCFHLVVAWAACCAEPFV